ncbi:MAG: substrate-binding domain-containing protein [Spirochaetaceae bacterium]|jgi:ABC-type sugar transport system substrate-binding protein|nr:substrate-binding domain-containing protein [Spirochaetaceae bacterium]
MMKKFLVLTVVFAALILAVSCQKKETGPVIGYICKNTTDTFAIGYNNAAREKLDGLKASGVIANWYFYDGQSDPVTQISLMDTAISQGCNYIIFLPAEAAGSAPVLDKAKEKNIPIIVVNSRTTNTDSIATAYVGSNDVQAGEMMANFVLEQLPQGGGWGHIQGPIGNSAQIERGEGIHNIMDTQANWTMLDEQPGNWLGEIATRFAEDWRTKYGAGLNAIICDNDDMSSAAQNVMNAAGRTDIICIGVDGNPGPLSMIKSGDLKATIYQDGIGQVSTGIDLVVDLINGKDVPKESWIDFVLITQDNVDQYLK